MIIKKIWEIFFCQKKNPAKWVISLKKKKKLKTKKKKKVFDFLSEGSPMSPPCFFQNLVEGGSLGTISPDISISLLDGK